MQRPRRRPDRSNPPGPGGSPGPDRPSRRTAIPLTGRSLLGAALVVGSVGTVLAAHRAAVAPAGTEVVAAARDLRAGATLRAEDRLLVRADLPAEVATVPAASAPTVIGATLTGDVEQGALLTTSDLTPTGAAPLGSSRISLSTPPERTPRNLGPGVRVDVLVTDAEQGTTDLVISGATVTATTAGGDGAIGTGAPMVVELAVPDGLAAAAVVDAAVRHQVTLVVPTGTPPGTPPGPADPSPGGGSTSG